MKNNKINQKLTRSEKLNLTLTTELEEILFCLMLGDLHAERKNSNCNTRMQFKQSIKNKDYIEHLYLLFNLYCGSKPESFSLSENEKLKKILKKKFNLDCGLHKHTNGTRLYIFSSSKVILLELIRPYLIPHFYYKFDIKDKK